MEVFRNSYTVKNNQLIITLPNSFKATEVDVIILPTEEHDWYDDLTIEQKKSIERGRAQLKVGEGVPHETVKTRIRQLIENTKSV